MKEPTLAADGHVYERVCMEQWLQTGARTSPVTNQRLAHTTLTPVHAIKSMIADFIEETRELGGALLDSDDDA